MPPHATAPSPLGSLAEQGVALIRRRARALLAVSVIFGLPGTLLSVASVLPLATTLQRLVPDGTAETLPPLDDPAVREIGLGILDRKSTRLNSSH